MRRAFSFACMCLCQAVLLAQSAGIGVVQKNGDATSSSTSNGVDAPSSISDPDPLGDYVPCIFGENDELSMRAQPPAQKPQTALDSAHAELLFDKVNVAVQNELASHDLKPEFVSAFQAYFNQKVNAESLTTLTPDAAIAKIQSVVSTAIANARIEAKYVKDPVSTLSSQQLQDAKNNVSTLLASTVTQAISSLQADKSKTKSKVTPDDAINSAATAITKAATDLKLTDLYRDDVLARFRDYADYDRSRRFSFQPSTVADDVFEAARKASEYPYIQPPEASKTTVQDNLATELYAAISDATKQAATPPPAKQFQPPSDVSCSIAVLSWRETHDIFGRRVANTFVAIQVTMRNLNTKNEFLIHDIQVAVDTGMTPEFFGRFQAGRDKLLVRAVAQGGQSSDPRNVTANVLQAIGSIAGASSVTAGTVEFKDAVAVFQSAFLPGFANIFPDRTVEELNHINDLVFSASSTSKVVVPVQGSVPLVTFISEKPLEELPFAWCGHDNSGRFHRKRIESCDFNGGAHNSGYPNEPFDNSKPWDSLKYQDWSAAALRMLQMHTFVVVGGVHIQQIVTQPKITNLTCSILSSGQLDLSQTKDGGVSCSAMGSGLNLVSNTTLEKGTSSISGKIQPATDGNSAVLTFNPGDLCDKQGAYSLAVAYKSDSQRDPTSVDSGESIMLGKQPVLNSITFVEDKLDLNGACLDQLNTVSLAAQVGDAVVNGSSPIADQTAKNTTASSQFIVQNASGRKDGLLPGATYYVNYTSKIQPNFVIKKEALTVSIPAQAAPGDNGQK